jgi:hypothetical protein
VAPGLPAQSKTNLSLRLCATDNHVSTQSG